MSDNKELGKRDKEWLNSAEGYITKEKQDLISEFVEKLKGKWKYLTVHMYEMKSDPNYEEEVESVLKDLIEE